jgi:hypothetical protein
LFLINKGFEDGVNDFHSKRKKNTCMGITTKNGMVVELDGVKTQGIRKGEEGEEEVAKTETMTATGV